MDDFSDVDRVRDAVRRMINRGGYGIRRRMLRYLGLSDSTLRRFDTVREDVSLENYHAIREMVERAGALDPSAQMDLAFLFEEADRPEPKEPDLGATEFNRLCDRIQKRLQGASSDLQCTSVPPDVRCRQFARFVDDLQDYARILEDAAKQGRPLRVEIKE